MTLKFSDFLLRANNKFGDRYEYDINSWQGTQYPMRFHCKDHGWQTQLVKDHLRSPHGCKNCAALKNSNWKIKSFETFVSEAVETHGPTYQYFEDTYEKYSTKTTINCKNMVYLRNYLVLIFTKNRDVQHVVKKKHEMQKLFHLKFFRESN